jgi:RNA polymerase sigma factor (sigma-70 family)
MSDRIPTSAALVESDQDLLRKFAHTAQEAPFRELVSRYAGFVTAVARRTTGSSDLAEETAQAVFAVLARKAASVARTDHLAGWLHRTTVFDALRRLRSETRYRRKLAAFANFMTPPASATLPDQPDILRFLDASLQRLRENERRVLIMRYFEERSYASIAEATEKSEAAAKKQTARAIERLRALLQRRGATCSIAGLAGVLAGQSCAQASVTVSALAASALRSAPTLGWQTLAMHSLHLMKTSNLIATVAVVLLCAIPLAWQERGIAAARRDVASLKTVQPRQPETATAEPAAATPAPSAAAAVVMDIEQVAKDVEAAQVDGILTARTREAAKEAKGRLESIDAPVLLKLLDDVLNLSGSPSRKQIVEAYLFTRLGEIDPLLAVRAAPNLIRRRPGSTTLSIALGTFLCALLQKDPEAALREFHSLKESDGLEGKGTNSASSSVYGRFVAQLFTVRPDEAIKLYPTLDLGGRLNALANAGAIESAEMRGFFIAEISKLEPRWQRSMFSTMLASELKRSGLNGATALFKELQLPSDQAVETVATFLHDTNSGKAGAHLSIGDRLNWLRQQLPAEQFAKAGGLFLGKTFEFESSKYLQEARNREFRAYDWGEYRDEAIAALFKPEKAPDDAAEAFSLAVEIRDATLRMETLQRLARRFKDSPTAYKAAIEASTTLTPDEKSQIFQP